MMMVMPKTPLKTAIAKVKTAAAITLLLSGVPMLLFLSGCTSIGQSANLLSSPDPKGQAVGKTVEGVKIPLGAKQAWKITITYEIDAAKAAQDNAGKAILVQPVPPSMSRGTNSNQEIKATLTCDGRSAKTAKDSFGEDVLVLPIASNSGTAILEYKGVVFNRDMRNIANGGVELTAAERKKFTAPHFVNHEALQEKRRVGRSVC